MKLKFTKRLPTKEGFYWWTHFGEHTPTILEVRKDYSSGNTLWASNEEFSFQVQKPEIDADPESMVDGHYFGEEFWCYIPNPFMPNGKQVKPNCY